MKKFLSFIACLTLTATSLTVPVSAENGVSGSGTNSESTSATITGSTSSSNDDANKTTNTAAIPPQAFVKDSDGNVVINSNYSLYEIIHRLTEDIENMDNNYFSYMLSTDNYEPPLIDNINNKYYPVIKGASANGYFKGRIYTTPTKTYESEDSNDPIYSYDTVFEQGLNQIQVQGVYSGGLRTNEYLRFTFGDQSVALIGCAGVKYTIVEEDEPFDYLTTDVVESLATLELEYTGKEITNIAIDNISVDTDDINYGDLYNTVDDKNVLASYIVDAIYRGEAKPTITGSGKDMVLDSKFTLLGTEYTIRFKVTDYNSSSDKAVLTVESVSCDQETIDYDSTLMISIDDDKQLKGFYGDCILTSGDIDDHKYFCGTYENLTDLSTGHYTGALYDSGNGVVSINDERVKISNQINYLTNLGEITRGDINGDGKINVVDMVLLKKFNLGIQTPKLNQSGPADINGDDSIDARDLVILKKYVLGILDSLT